LLTIWFEYFRRQWRNDASRYTLRERLTYSWRMAWAASFATHWQNWPKLWPLFFFLQWGWHWRKVVGRVT
jgi:hypothetical protein